MAKPVFIYCLKDPTTGDVRYIGKAESLEKRLEKHLRESIKRKNHLGCWLRSLGAKRPIIEVLHEVTENESWQEEERRYISCARAIGMDLVNATDGGEGGSGPCSPEQCAARGALRKGKPWSPAQRAASDAKRGVPLSPAAKAAYAAKSAALTGVLWSRARRNAQPSQVGVPWSSARRAAYERGKLAKSPTK